ncbi:MAG: PAS domain-containing protein [Elusimicrobia bacterium]|nr:PAS domain-containing protein [Elusimicrobiota bacterium]
MSSPAPSDAALAEFLSPATKALLDFIYDGVYVVDNDRKILFWNRAAERLTGYKAVDVLGRCCRHGILNHVDENGRLLCNEECPLTEVIKSGQRDERKVFPMHKSGHRFPTVTHAAPIKDASARIIGAIEVFRDISAEERHAALQEKFEKLIRQYVSRTTYESVLDAAAKDVAPRAATKDLTVLFLDVVAFTSLVEKQPVGRIVEMLNQLFSLCTHVIQRHSGDVDKFIGDCVMAVFVDAQDAVDAAREMLDNAMPSLNRALSPKGLPEVQVRIGINSGRLIQGDIGSSERKDMTVIGDVVNTAARVRVAAEPGGFLIAESTYARLVKPGEFVFCKEISLKGKDQPVRLFMPKECLRSGS